MSRSARNNIFKWVKLLSLTTMIIFGFIFQVITVNAQSASLYITPNSNTLHINETFTVTIAMSSPDITTNAASGHLIFPPDILEVVSINKGGSVIDFWVQSPAFSNTSGYIQFEGISHTPGFQGTYGKLISITFRAKSPGSADVVFSRGALLANDGQGTNIANALGNAQFIVAGYETITKDDQEQTQVQDQNPVVSENKQQDKQVIQGNDTQENQNKTPEKIKILSETHPDQEKWSNNINPELFWEINDSDNIDQIKLRVSELPDTEPSTIYTNGLTKKNLFNLKDGIWYFYVALHNKNGWSEFAGYTLNIDATSPEELTLSLENDIFGFPLVSVNASDALSGIDTYKIQIDGIHSALKVDGEGLYYVSDISIGEHIATVTTTDNAGNETIKKIKVKVDRYGIIKFTFNTPGRVLSGTTQYGAAGTSTPQSGPNITISTSKINKVDTLLAYIQLGVIMFGILVTIAMYFYFSYLKTSNTKYICTPVKTKKI